MYSLWEVHSGHQQPRVEASFSLANTTTTLLTLIRKHLYLDLRPYNCLYGGCTFSMTPFVDRQQWSNHLGLEHKLGPEWHSMQCPLCLNSILPGRDAIVLHLSRHLEDIALAALPREVASDTETEEEEEPKSLPGHSSGTLRIGQPNQSSQWPVTEFSDFSSDFQSSDEGKPQSNDDK